MINYERDWPSKWCYLPPVGEEREFDIKEIKKVECDNPKFNFTETKQMDVTDPETGEIVSVEKKKDLGYHIECDLVSGQILTITSISAWYKVFVANKIQDGEKVRIKHIDKGEWEVERLEGPYHGTASIQ